MKKPTIAMFIVAGIIVIGIIGLVLFVTGNKDNSNAILPEAAIITEERI